MSILDRWFALPARTSPQHLLQETTARFIIITSLLSLGGVLSYVVFSAITQTGTVHMYLVAALYLLGSSTVLLLVRSERAVLAAHALVLVNWLAAANFLFTEGPQTGHIGIFFVAIVLAGLLRGPFAAVFYGFSSAATLLVANFAVKNDLITVQPGEQEAWTQQAPQLIVVGLLIAVLVRGLHRTLRELQASQGALQSSQRQLHTLVDNSPDGLMMFDASGQCTTVNPAALQMLERTPAQLLGTNAPGTGLWSGDGLDPATFQDGVEIRALDVGEGERRLLEVNAHRIEELGQTLGFELVLRDVTARLTAEKVTRELESRLRRATRTEALGRLAGGVAHDFNNLLTIMIGNTCILSLEPGLSEEARERVSEIEEAADRAAAVTQQLLSFGRKQEKGVITIDVRVVIEDMKRMMKRLLGEQVELVIEQPDQPAWVTIEPVQLEQIIANLVINAQDAMPTGGRLSLSVRCVTLQDKAAKHVGISPGEWVELRCTDTGVGMSEEIIEKVFEAFFSTKSGGKNTGLGLSTVQLIVQTVGGGIDVRSRQGEGTSFTIWLPPGETPDVEEPAPDTIAFVPAPIPTNNLVCFVDDDKAIRRLVQDALTTYGYRVVCGESADEVLAVLEAHTLIPELLVTDVILRQSNGVEVAQQLIERYPRLPVLYVSGYPGAVLENYNLSVENVLLLNKPFSIQELLAHVQQALKVS